VKAVVLSGVLLLMLEAHAGQVAAQSTTTPSHKVA